MNKGFMFSTDALIGLATVIIASLILTFPYSIEEGSEANISFIKQEVSGQAEVAYYYGRQTAKDIGLKSDNSDFNNFDYAECFILYDYDFKENESIGVYVKQGQLTEMKYCMGKRSLR